MLGSPFLLGVQQAQFVVFTMTVIITIGIILSLHRRRHGQVRGSCMMAKQASKVWYGQVSHGLSQGKYYLNTKRDDVIVLCVRARLLVCLLACLAPVMVKRI